MEPSTSTHSEPDFLEVQNHSSTALFAAEFVKLTASMPEHLRYNFAQTCKKQAKDAALLKIAETLGWPREIKFMNKCYCKFRKTYEFKLKRLIMKCLNKKIPPERAFELPGVPQWLKDTDKHLALLPVLIKKFRQPTPEDRKAQFVNGIANVAKQIKRIPSGQSLCSLAKTLGTTNVEVQNMWIRIAEVATWRLENHLTVGCAVEVHEHTSMDKIDWEVIDLLIVYEEIRDLVTDESLSCPATTASLDCLCSLVAQNEIEAQCSPLLLHKHWHNLYKEYIKSHRVHASLLLLQRRWYELKRNTARAILARMSGASAASPHRLYVHVAGTFPHVVTQPQTPWQEMVRKQLIVTRLDKDMIGVHVDEAENKYCECELLKESLAHKKAENEADDDVIILEKDVETIDLWSNTSDKEHESDDDHGNRLVIDDSIDNKLDGDKSNILMTDAKYSVPGLKTYSHIETSNGFIKITPVDKVSDKVSSSNKVNRQLLIVTRSDSNNSSGSDVDDGKTIETSSKIESLTLSDDEDEGTLIIDLEEELCQDKEDINLPETYNENNSTKTDYLPQLRNRSSVLKPKFNIKESPDASNKYRSCFAISTKTDSVPKPDDLKLKVNVIKGVSNNSRHTISIVKVSPSTKLPPELQKEHELATISACKKLDDEMKNQLNLINKYSGDLNDTEINNDMELNIVKDKMKGNTEVVEKLHNKGKLRRSLRLKKSDKLPDIQTKTISNRTSIDVLQLTPRCFNFSDGSFPSLELIQKIDPTRAEATIIFEDSDEDKINSNDQTVISVVEDNSNDRIDTVHADRESDINFGKDRSLYDATKMESDHSYATNHKQISESKYDCNDVYDMSHKGKYELDKNNTSIVCDSFQNKHALKVDNLSNNAYRHGCQKTNVQEDGYKENIDRNGTENIIESIKTVTTVENDSKYNEESNVEIYIKNYDEAAIFENGKGLDKGNINNSKIKEVESDTNILPTRYCEKIDTSLKQLENLHVDDNRNVKNVNENENLSPIVVSTEIDSSISEKRNNIECELNLENVKNCEQYLNKFDTIDTACDINVHNSSKRQQNAYTILKSLLHKNTTLIDNGITNTINNGTNKNIDTFKQQNINEFKMTATDTTASVAAVVNNENNGIDKDSNNRDTTVKNSTLSDNCDMDNSCFEVTKAVNSTLFENCNIDNSNTIAINSTVFVNSDIHNSDIAAVNPTASENSDIDTSDTTLVNSSASGNCDIDKSDNTPVNSTPSENSVIDKSDNTPVNSTPSENSDIDKSDNTPVNSTPSENSDIDKSDNTPVNSTPSENSDIDKSDNTPVNSTPSENFDIDKSDNTPVNSTPSENSDIDKSDNTPVNSTPSENSDIDKSDNTPVNSTPSENSDIDKSDNTPGNSTPSENSDIDKSDNTPVNSTPSENSDFDKSDNTPVNSTPSENSDIDKSDNTPVNSTPSENSDIDKSDNTPVNSTPSENYDINNSDNTLVNTTPSENSGNDKSHTTPITSTASKNFDIDKSDTTLVNSTPSENSDINKSDTTPISSTPSENSDIDKSDTTPENSTPSQNSNINKSDTTPINSTASENCDIDNSGGTAANPTSPANCDIDLKLLMTTQVYLIRIDETYPNLQTKPISITLDNVVIKVSNNDDHLTKRKTSTDGEFELTGAEFQSTDSEFELTDGEFEPTDSEFEPTNDEYESTLTLVDKNDNNLEEHHAMDSQPTYKTRRRVVRYIDSDESDVPPDDNERFEYTPSYKVKQKQISNAVCDARENIILYRVDLNSNRNTDSKVPLTGKIEDMIKYCKVARVVLERVQLRNEPGHQEFVRKVLLPDKSSLMKRPTAHVAPLTATSRSAIKAVGNFPTQDELQTLLQDLLKQNTIATVTSMSEEQEFTQENSTTHNAQGPANGPKRPRFALKGASSLLDSWSQPSQNLDSRHVNDKYNDDIYTALNGLYSKKTQVSSARPRKRPRPSIFKISEDTAPGPAAKASDDNGYNEWIREKNLTKRFFDFPQTTNPKRRKIIAGPKSKKLQNSIHNFVVQNQEIHTPTVSNKNDARPSRPPNLVPIGSKQSPPDNWITEETTSGTLKIVRTSPKSLLKTDNVLDIESSAQHLGNKSGYKYLLMHSKPKRKADTDLKLKRFDPVQPQLEIKNQENLIMDPNNTDTFLKCNIKTNRKCVEVDIPIENCDEKIPRKIAKHSQGNKFDTNTLIGLTVVMPKDLEKFANKTSVEDPLPCNSNVKSNNDKVGRKQDPVIKVNLIIRNVDKDKTTLNKYDEGTSRLKSDRYANTKTGDDMLESENYTPIITNVISLADSKVTDDQTPVPKKIKITPVSKTEGRAKLVHNFHDLANRTSTLLCKTKSAIESAKTFLISLNSGISSSKTSSKETLINQNGNNNQSHIINLLRNTDNNKKFEPSTSTETSMSPTLNKPVNKNCNIEKLKMKQNWQVKNTKKAETDIAQVSNVNALKVAQNGQGRSTTKAELREPSANTPKIENKEQVVNTPRRESKGQVGNTLRVDRIGQVRNTPKVELKEQIVNTSRVDLKGQGGNTSMANLKRQVRSTSVADLIGQSVKVLTIKRPQPAVDIQRHKPNLLKRNNKPNPLKRNNKPNPLKRNIPKVLKQELVSPTRPIAHTQKFVRIAPKIELNTERDEQIVSDIESNTQELPVNHNLELDAVEDVTVAPKLELKADKNIQVEPIIEHPQDENSSAAPITPSNLLAAITEEYVAGLKPADISTRVPETVEAYLRQRDERTDAELICVDGSRPLFKLSEDTICVTDSLVVIDEPTFWSVAPKGQSSIVLLDQTGDPDAQSLPSEDIYLDNKWYKKLSDEPLVYARIYRAIPDYTTLQQMAAQNENIYTYSLTTGSIVPACVSGHTVSIPAFVPLVENVLPIDMAQNPHNAMNWSHNHVMMNNMIAPNSVMAPNNMINPNSMLDPNSMMAPNNMMAPNSMIAPNMIPANIGIVQNTAATYNNVPLPKLISLNQFPKASTSMENNMVTINNCANTNVTANTMYSNCMPYNVLATNNTMDQTCELTTEGPYKANRYSIGVINLESDED